MLSNKKILLVIAGGIAAYKSLELIRLLKKSGATVQCLMTKSAEQFVTPLSVSALSQNKVYNDLWSLNDESEMGHIRLSRESDLVVIAPASANFIAKIVHGFANDLASATLLASKTPIMIAPAMNPAMWDHTATQENISKLKARGIKIIGPDNGEMACGEIGSGRMCEPDCIFDAIKTYFTNGPLKNKKVIVTAGPTHEPIDPVRFIGNRSSGLQGYAIAEALSHAGAYVTLISGPVNLDPPKGLKIVRVNTAREMYEAAVNSLPADIAICTAAVGDWRPKIENKNKIKKSSDKKKGLSLDLVENPDILSALSIHKTRPEIVVGFAAETNDLEKNALEKIKKKKCDFLLANLVGPDSDNQERAFGASENQIYLVKQDQTIEQWPRMSKKDIAAHLTALLIESIGRKKK